MHGKTHIILVFGLVLFLQGCETAKGFQQDVKNTWGNLSKMDSWMKENMW